MAINDSPGRGDDGWILSNTKQITNNEGHLKFEIELPSGRKVESEFFNPEHARRALLTWIVTIKGEQESDKAADVASARQRARELGLLNRVKPKTDNPDAPLDSAPTQPQIIYSPPPAKATPQVAPPSVPSSITPPVSPERASPDDFARNGLALARKDVDYWKGVAQGAQAEWQKAQREVEKWERMITAMGGGVTIGDNATVPAPAGVILTVPSVRKRGRPRKDAAHASDNTSRASAAADTNVKT